MHPVLERLSGGDRRSIGVADEVVLEVLGQPLPLKNLLPGWGVTIRFCGCDARTFWKKSLHSIPNGCHRKKKVDR